MPKTIAFSDPTDFGSGVSSILITLDANDTQARVAVLAHGTGPNGARDEAEEIFTIARTNPQLVTIVAAALNAWKSKRGY